MEISGINKSGEKQDPVVVKQMNPYVLSGEHLSNVLQDLHNVHMLC